MVDVEVIGQLVDSMGDAVLKLEKAVGKRDKVGANKMKIFILDLQKRINNEIDGREEMTDGSLLPSVEGKKKKVKKKRKRRSKK